MGVIEGSTLNAFMDAVTDYYGADVWAGITNNAAFTSADFASKITQIDGISATYLKNGNVAYYTYNGQIVAQGSNVGNIVNSNMGNIVESTAIEVPAETSIASGTTVTATSGMKSAATGLPVQTVVKDVAIGIGAVAAGLQAGAGISSLLYNSNPRFWDANGMSALNPQVWDSIVSSEGGKDVFNFVFGINKTNGTVTPYMDEKALAYVIGYMQDQDAFSPYTEGVTIEDTTGLILDGINFPIIETDVFRRWNDTHQYYLEYTPGTNSAPVHFAVFTDALQPPYNAQLQLILASEAPFTLNEFSSLTQNTTKYESIQTTFKGKTYYTYTSLGSVNYETLDGIYNITVEPYSQVSMPSVAYAILYGDKVTISGVPGISQQPGAVLPTGITDPSDIDDILTKLKQQYPDLFTDSIVNDVVQPDGSIIQTTYVPVVIPESITHNETTGEPEATGGEKQKQGDQAVTEDSIDEAIKNLIDILTSVDPSNPTKTPPATGDPDVGTGTTPVVVTPQGSANALYSIYNPTQAQLNSLGAWLWSSNFVDQLLKVFNDPMQAIIGLHKIFVSPPINGSGEIKVGYLGTGVNANLVSNQYTQVNCGNITLREYFGSSLDYTHTDVYLYLPFIGIVPLNVNDVMRGTINVTYKVDVLTGACIAMINVIRDGNAGGQLYCYTGNCAAQYPLSSGSYMGILSGALGIAASAIGAVATGGATIPLALGIGASALTGMKTNIEHSGSLSGNAGALGIKKPYLIIRRPQTKIATGYEIFSGSSNNAIVTLASCIGFTRAKYVHLENIPASRNEMTEIESLLTTGIIV